MGSQRPPELDPIEADIERTLLPGHARYIPDSEKPVAWDVLGERPHFWSGPRLAGSSEAIPPASNGPVP